MSQVISNPVPAPTGSSGPNNVPYGDEKFVPNDADARETASDLEKPSDFDKDGEVKQDGVKRVEAITTVWSKELLIAMFVL